jgi:hypothetical protein
MSFKDYTAPMKTASKMHAFLACGLAVFFSWAFFVLKHNPLFRHIIPFAEDPYDAVGSMAFIAGNLLAATCLVRVLLPHLAGRSGAGIYVARTEAAVSLCVLMTVSTDAVAMLRHFSQWRGSSGENALLMILSSLLAASIGVLIVIRPRAQPPSFGRWVMPCIVFIAALLCLWLYPESLIHNTVAHLITCDIADVLLIAPVAFFVLTLFPDEASQTTHVASSSHGFGSIPRWTIVTLLGLSIGLTAFLAEFRDSAGSVPIARMAFVGSVYAYLGLSGMLVAYAFLRKPLGFLIAD